MATKFLMIDSVAIYLMLYLSESQPGKAPATGVSTDSCVTMRDVDRSRGSHYTVTISVLRTLISQFGVGRGSEVVQS